MPQPTTNYGASVGAQAARLSDGTSTLRELLRAKQLSDRGKYRDKQLILRKLMEQSGKDFFVDSSPDPKIVGITHRPTNFRIHIPRMAVPEGVAKSNE